MRDVRCMGCHVWYPASDVVKHILHCGIHPSHSQGRAILNVIAAGRNLLVALDARDKEGARNSIESLREELKGCEGIV